MLALCNILLWPKCNIDISLYCFIAISYYSCRGRGEWHGLVVSTEECHSNGRRFKSRLFQIFLRPKIDQLLDDPWKTREKPECEATRQGNETRRENEKSGSSERRRKNRQVKAEWLRERKRYMVRSTWEKAIKWFHAIYQQKKASYSE